MAVSNGAHKVNAQHCIEEHCPSKELKQKRTRLTGASVSFCKQHLCISTIHDWRNRESEGGNHIRHGKAQDKSMVELLLVLPNIRSLGDQVDNAARPK